MKKAYRGLICTECGMEHEDGIYQRCLNCGMPAANCLRATYEFDLLRKVGLKGIIDRNKNSIWRYKTFLPVLDAANIISLGEGFTPIVTCRNLGKKYHYEEFYVMNEGVNPTHSFKDRGVSVFVSKAVELGGKVLAASSAGNLGTSVAAYSSKIGKKCFIIIPASTRFERLRQLMVFRPIILPLRGSVDDVHDFTSEVYERFGWFDINWALRPFYIEGMKTIAFEISERFNWSPPDWVIVPTGSGASITAIWKGFSDLKKVGLLKKVPRMVAVQPKGYDPITRAFVRNRDRIVPVRPTKQCLATGARIRNPSRHGCSTLKAVRESNGYSVSVTNREMITAQKELAGSEGIFPEITSAMAIAAAKKMIRERITIDSSVLCIISSTGIKEMEVLKDYFKRPRSVKAGDVFTGKGGSMVQK